MTSAHILGDRVFNLAWESTTLARRVAAYGDVLKAIGTHRREAPPRLLAAVHEVRGGVLDPLSLQRGGRQDPDLTDAYHRADTLIVQLMGGDIEAFYPQEIPVGSLNEWGDPYSMDVEDIVEGLQIFSHSYTQLLAEFERLRTPFLQRIPFFCELASIVRGAGTHMIHAGTMCFDKPSRDRALCALAAARELDAVLDVKPSDVPEDSVRPKAAQAQVVLEGLIKYLS